MVKCPELVIDSFIKAAKVNTEAKVKTVGLLGGKQYKKDLVVTTLIIPEQ